MGERTRIVDGLAATWQSTIDVCRDLSEDDWNRPTGCPGWTVKDQVSHLIGTENMLLGKPAAAHDTHGAYGDHVRNDIGRFNEAETAARRDRPGKEVLAELEDVVAERLEALRALDDAGWSKETMTPVGPGTYETFMGIRVFDSWVHEQDVRRALHQPGHLEGPAVDLSLEHVLPSLGRTVGKKAGAPEGSTVVIELTGPLARTVAVGVEGGRAKLLPEPPSDPTATLSLDGETFVALACGRSDADPSTVHTEGDQNLARRVVDNLAFTI